MQRLRHRPLRSLHQRPLPPGGERRRGAVLIVVLGLLGLLMFLGFAFYTFARQEEGNAEYFNASARRRWRAQAAGSFWARPRA